jgi:hypothetical protein
LLLDGQPEQFGIVHRINGGPSHTRMLDPGEVAYLAGGTSQGALAPVFDIEVGELVPGTNTFEFATTGVPTLYPPGIVDVDLVLDVR